MLRHAMTILGLMALTLLMTGCATDLEGGGGLLAPGADGGFVNNGNGGFVDGTPDAGEPEADDTGDPSPDTLDPNPDVVDPDPDQDPDETPDPNPDPVDPCEGVQCQANAACVDGDCRCEQGFEDQNGECVPFDPGDPALRSEVLVCERWLSEYGERAMRVSIGSNPQACEPGTIDPTAHDDAMRRLNLYRWLLGMAPAGTSEDAKRTTQQAALMMDVNNRLSHAPTPDWTCYTEEGAQSAGSSNLALGYPTAAASIDGYIEDGGTPSLGHRRWCFFPQLDGVGFGHVGRGGAMHVFTRNNNQIPDFIAYPSPGPFPTQGLHGVWSFSAAQLGANATATVTPQSSGADIVAGVDFLQQGFGLNTIAIRLSENARVGETYTVEINSGARSWSYETRIVSCQ